MKNTLITLSLIALFFFINLPIMAQSPITFEPTTIENNFPQALGFKSSVKSSDGDIVAAKLFFHLRNQDSVNVNIIEIDNPAPEVSLNYTWETDNLTVPPSAPVFYHWEVKDSAGNTAVSEESLVHYDDIRYDWQILENENLAVWWHDRPASFGEGVFELAVFVFNEQQPLFGTTLEFPIRIIIYNTQAEFAAWHSFDNKNVGGEAFSGMGITTQIVGDNIDQNVWLADVIPHEISHLYFFQVTDHPLISVPAWLNEGLAQYNELNDNQATLEIAKRAIENGDLIPLVALSGGFGHDRDEFYLAYAESLSAVKYLIETYNEEGLADLLAAYKQGKSHEKAFIDTFGRTPQEFQQDWLASLGIPLEMYPTPTPLPKVVFPPTPTMMGYVPKNATPTEQTPPTVTPTPTKEAVAVISSLTPTATSTKQPQQQNAEQNSNTGCINGLLFSSFMLGLISLKRNK